MPAPGHCSLVGAAIVFAVGLAILAYALIGAGASADAAPDRVKPRDRAARPPSRPICRAGGGGVASAHRRSHRRPWSRPEATRRRRPRPPRPPPISTA
jgi:hypothetical protein